MSTQQNYDPDRIIEAAETQAKISRLEAQLQAVEGLR